MTLESPTPRMPTSEEVLAILAAPASGGLFPLGDCDDREFRELLCTSLGCPVAWEALGALLTAQPERSVGLPELVQDLRRERDWLRRGHPGAAGILLWNLAAQ